MGQVGFAGLGLASLYNFGELWRIGIVLKCLVPVLTGVREGEQWPCG